MRKFLCIAILLCALPSWATWSIVQTKCNAACAGGTTCGITTSATGTGNLIVVGSIVDFTGATQSISSVSGGGTYTHSTVARAVTGGEIDMSYTLASTAGATTITLTLSASTVSNQWRACMAEFSSSTGGIALDTGATPQASNSIASAAPVSPALTVSGANLAVVSEILWGGTITGASSPYNVSGLQPNGNGFAVAINIVSGSGAAWTPTTVNTGGAAAIAFKENAGGAATKGFSKEQKLEKFWPQ
jgi:hypothetical protein